MKLEGVIRTKGMRASGPLASALGTSESGRQSVRPSAISAGLLSGQRVFARHDKPNRTANPSTRHAQFTRRVTGHVARPTPGSRTWRSGAVDGSYCRDTRRGATPAAHTRRLRPCGSHARTVDAVTRRRHGLLPRLALDVAALAYEC